MIVKGVHFPVIQVFETPQGTPEYEEKHAALLQAFWDPVPKDYYLPADIIRDSPKDVSKIPSTCGILTPDEIAITENYDCTGLAHAIATKKYTAVAVATAFSKRAIICHQLTCCLSQWFMDSAVKQAKALDDYFEANGHTVGPLHGVPISLKDHIPIARTYSSGGCFGSILKNEKDSQMVRILRSLGAVFYCKTNQPQSTMHLETDSHWGRVLNPFNIHLSAGGSTGGEAALVAMYGSPMGVGTDVGGSVRAPSAFCGIYGFKSTTSTLPMKNFTATIPPAELNMTCSAGPMCRSLRDVDLFMKLVLSVKPYLEDPRIVPIPWTGLQTPITRKLKVGIITNDGFIDPQPPVKRAIAWVKQTLSDSKYSSIVEIKDFKPFAAEEAWSKVRRLYWPDGAKATIKAIEATGEPIHPLSAWAWKDAEHLGVQDTFSLLKARAERDDFRLQFAESWERQDVDVVIGPAFVGPASQHETAFYWTYTSLYNLVDYPACVFPTPIKARTKEEYDENYRPLSEQCAHVRRLWEEGNFEGAPIGLQIIARRHHDNELAGALNVLQQAFGLP